MRNTGALRELGYRERTSFNRHEGRFSTYVSNLGYGHESLQETDPSPRKAGLGNSDIAEKTGPLSILRGKRILVLTDVENLYYGARDLGYKLSFGSLGSKLVESSDSCHLHAFFSRSPGDARQVRYFQERGWIAHPRDIEKVRTFKGQKTLSNSDNMILLHTGFLARTTSAQVVVVASGDGTMTCDIAKFIKALPRNREVVTLSLAGSTSWRLDANQNPEIKANMEIGLDCLHKPNDYRFTQ